MLSILIPVYNHDVRSLVEELHQQCCRAAIAFEIFCYDDTSLPVFQDVNKEINRWKEVRYRLLPKNLGRSRIRNLMASEATYEYLLFMDCDSRVIGADYIQVYLDHLRPGCLLYGGRVYGQSPPADSQLYLHWYYGRQREQVPAVERLKDPYHSFMTNNFLIPKTVFQKTGFDERLRQYGHEDTLFGFDLRERKIPILHLDNPLEHTGLEPATIFLDKTKKAVENLFFLTQNTSLIETRLLNIFRRIRSAGLDKLIFPILRPAIPFIRTNLESKRPSLRLLDLYKLFLLLEEARRK